MIVLNIGVFIVVVTLSFALGYFIGVCNRKYR